MVGSAGVVCEDWREGIWGWRGEGYLSLSSEGGEVGISRMVRHTIALGLHLAAAGCSAGAKMAADRVRCYGDGCGRGWSKGGAATTEDIRTPLLDPQHPGVGSCSETEVAVATSAQQRDAVLQMLCRASSSLSSINLACPCGLVRTGADADGRTTTPKLAGLKL